MTRSHPAGYKYNLALVKEHYVTHWLRVLGPAAVDRRIGDQHTALWVRAERKDFTHTLLYLFKHKIIEWQKSSFYCCSFVFSGEDDTHEDDESRAVLIAIIAVSVPVSVIAVLCIIIRFTRGTQITAADINLN